MNVNPCALGIVIFIVVAALLLYGALVVGSRSDPKRNRDQ